MAFTTSGKKLLYSRFHQHKHRAANKGYRFHWKDFNVFLADVEKIAGDMQPDRFRIVFDMKRVPELGFCAETMSIDPYDEWNQTSRKQVERLTPSINPLMIANVSAHLAVLLMTENAEIETLINEAMMLASHNR